MGKASKWFKGLLGFKKPDPTNTPPHSKRRWSFAISHREKDRRNDDHAAAVVAASAAVAEAAVAAAQAAAAVVKLTSGGGFKYVTQGYGRREESAAVMIQSHFRAYLSRQALRALKALVMLQALVRGQILRKHYFEKLRRMQAIVRPISYSSPLYHFGEAMQERLDYTILARKAVQGQLLMLKRKGSRSKSCNVNYDHDKSPLLRRTRLGERSWEQGSFRRIISTDDERSDKILEVDTWKPKQSHIFGSPQLSHTSNQYYQSFSVSGEVCPLKLRLDDDDDDEHDFTTAENSPQYYSASSMGGGSSSSIRTPFRTPTKNDSSSGCLDYPSYMAYTESSKAKVRSLSAPKQRPPYERSSSTNRYFVPLQKASALHANFTNKVYSGSGRLDRLGMPVGGDGGGHWHRY